MRNYHDSNFGRRIISVDNMFQNKRNYFDNSSFERKDKESLESSLSQTTINENESRKHYSNNLSDTTSIQSNSAPNHQIHSKILDIQQLQRHKELTEPLGDICCKLDEVKNNQNQFHNDIVNLLGNHTELEKLVLEYITKNNEKYDTLQKSISSVQSLLHSSMKEIYELLMREKNGEMKIIISTDTDAMKEKKEENELSVSDYFKNCHKSNKRIRNARNTEVNKKTSDSKDCILYDTKEDYLYPLSQDSPFNTPLSRAFNDNKHTSKLNISDNQWSNLLEEAHHGYHHHLSQHQNQDITRDNRHQSYSSQRELLKDSQIDMLFEEYVDDCRNINNSTSTANQNGAIQKLPIIKKLRNSEETNNCNYKYSKIVSPPAYYQPTKLLQRTNSYGQNISVCDGDRTVAETTTAVAVAVVEAYDSDSDNDTGSDMTVPIVDLEYLAQASKKCTKKLNY